MNHLDWDALRLLLAVARAGSLRAAAAATGVSQPTLGRRLRDLERSLGQPLLVRHARGVTLTDDGHAAIAAATAVDERLLALQRAAAGRRAAVSGRVRLSCTEPVAAELLPRSLIRLRDAHPELAVDVVVDAHASDLDRREADLAIRMFPPDTPHLVARRVGATGTSFFAAEAYLARHGRPATFADLAQHRVIGPDRDPLFVANAERLGLSPAAATYRTDSFATVLAWVRSGVAIGALLRCVAAGLVELFPLAEHPVWLVTHPDLRGSAAVDAVWSALADDLPAALGMVA